MLGPNPNPNPDPYPYRYPLPTPCQLVMLAAWLVGSRHKLDRVRPWG